MTQKVSLRKTKLKIKPHRGSCRLFLNNKLRSYANKKQIRRNNLCCLPQEKAPSSNPSGFLIIFFQNHIFILLHEKAHSYVMWLGVCIQFDCLNGCVVKIRTSKFCSNQRWNSKCYSSRMAPTSPIEKLAAPS